MGKTLSLCGRRTNVERFARDSDRYADYVGGKVLRHVSITLGILVCAHLAGLRECRRQHATGNCIAGAHNAVPEC